MRFDLWPRAFFYAEVQVRTENSRAVILLMDQLDLQMHLSINYTTKALKNACQTFKNDVKTAREEFYIE